VSGSFTINNCWPLKSEESAISLFPVNLTSGSPSVNLTQLLTCQEVGIVRARRRQSVNGYKGAQHK
jgi:hypothetical protein